MADKAQVSISADITELRKQAALAKQEFSALHNEVLRSGPAMKTLEDGSQVAANSMAALKEQAEQYRQTLAKLDPQSKEFQATARKLNTVLEQQAQAQKKVAASGTEMGGGMKTATMASGALNVALGVLGAQSIQMVIMKMISLTGEALKLAISLDAMENRARAIFGDSFPKMQAAADNLAASMRRGKSDMLEFMTGFGTSMDSLGLAAPMVERLSIELTKLTVTLGKAFPDKSDAEMFEIIQSAIEGNMRGLRQLGIVLNDKILQDFAEAEGIKLKVAQMDVEQKSYLISQFLLKETVKLQEAGIASTGKLGDTVKSTSAQWGDFLETLGTDISPFVNSMSKTFLEMLQDWRTMIIGTKNALIDLFALPGTTINWALGRGWNSPSDIREQTAAIADKNKEIQTAQTLLAQNEQRFKETGKYGAPAEEDPMKDFWKNTGSGGGGGKSADDEALDKAKTIMSAIKDIEKGITDEQNKQISANMELRTMRRDELNQKQKMGVITKEESRELDTLNRRVAFGKDKVKEATDAWDKQISKVKSVKDEIQKLNDSIIEEHKRLQDTLAGIDKDAARRKADIDKDAKQSKIDVAADLTKELSDLDLKMARGEGNDQKDQDRRKEIEAALASVDRSIVDAGKAQAALNPFQKIDSDAAAKKKDADDEAKAKKIDIVTESNKKLEETLGKLAQANLDLAAAETAEKNARDAVVVALEELSTRQEAAYKAQRENTSAHVNSEIADMQRLGAQLDVLASKYAKVAAYKSDPSGIGKTQYKAGGGSIFGAMGTDTVPAMLTPGEFVHRTAAVRHYGLPFMEAINSLRLPRFANGGQVNKTYHNERNQNITQHFHHAALSSPSAQKYHLRMHSL